MIFVDHDRSNPLSYAAKSVNACSCYATQVVIVFLIVNKPTPLFRRHRHKHFLLIYFQIFSKYSFVFHAVQRSIVLLMVMFCCAFRYELDLEHEPW